MSDNQSAVLNLEEFWLDDPELWFAQTEARFWNFKIVDDLAKFKYIISHLDKHCLNIIRHVVLSPPVANKYGTLKAELLKKLKGLKIENIKEILMSENIGTRKPSEFLQHLKGLAGQDVPEEYVKSVWSSLLPAKVQWVSSFLTSSSLEKIAHLADFAMNSSAIKSSATKSHSNSDAAKAVVNNEENKGKEIVERVKNLAKKVEDLKVNIDNSENYRTSSNSTMTTRTASTINSATCTDMIGRNPSYAATNDYQAHLVFCWYHAQFGWYASKCVPPCNFSVSHYNMRYNYTSEM